MKWAYDLRSFAIFMVVVIHVTAGYVTYADAEPEFYGASLWWVANIMDSYSRWSVPVFVMLSGMFLLKSDASALEFYKRRMSRILIPVVFWSIFYIIWTIVKSYFNGNVISGIIDAIKYTILGKPYYHMWFLYMIPFLYFISPFLSKILNNSNRNEIITITAFSCIISIMATAFTFLMMKDGAKTPPSFFATTFLSYIGYFLLGAIIPHIKETSVRYASLLLFIASCSITALLAFKYGRSYFYDYISINVFISSVSIFIFFSTLKEKESNISKMLATLTLGVYLVHPLILEVSAYAWRHIFNMSVFSISYVLCLIAIVYIVSLFISLVFSKIPYLRKTI